MKLIQGVLKHLKAIAILWTLLKGGRGGGGGVRDLQLPESRLEICQIPVYGTNKMKNTVTGKTAH